MTLNILNKDFFKTDIGKRLAKKYFGYDYSEKPKNDMGFSQSFARKSSIDETVQEKNEQDNRNGVGIIDVSESLPEQLPLLEEVVEEPNFRNCFLTAVNKRKMLIKKIMVLALLHL